METKKIKISNNFDNQIKDSKQFSCKIITKQQSINISESSSKNKKKGETK